ncbi:MAG: type II toxin-antitoxin system RelE/ParE family toxin [Flavobacteriales bacterium]|nr:type II toxin-antitoxin system RelE/ParE family toxin [Flavobacteriales bacterium]
MRPLVVIWSDPAWMDLEAIFDFIAKNSREQAKKQIIRIIERTEQLSTQPLSGPLQPDIDPNLQARYLVQDNYKIIYFVDVDHVVVDTVFDTRQNPEKLKLRS